MKTYPHIRRALAGKLWYVHEQKMQEMLAFLEIKLAGGSSAPEVIASIRAANAEAAARAQGASKPGVLAVIPIYGMIMHRQMEDISGGSSGTSTNSLSMALRQAMDDPNVGSIVLDIDSPGGDVDGIDELASEIYQARKQKKITAVSNCLCASAAYYLAAQASEIVVSPSSLTGSIGVYTMHEDDSAMLEAAGIKLELIKYGENKAEGNSLGPLTDSAREHMQQIVDTYGIAFEKAVARGRGVKQDEVHGKFGQGRVFDAKTAVRIGMADRVGTLAEVLGQSGTGKSSGNSRAVAQAAEIEPVTVHGPGTDLAAITLPTVQETASRITVNYSDGITVSYAKCDVGSAPGTVPCKGCGVLLWANVHADYCLSCTKAAVRADDGGCSCDCVPCDGGDCDNCDHEDCACEGCTCEMATGKAKAAELAQTRARDFDRMRHELNQAAAC